MQSLFHFCIDGRFGKGSDSAGTDIPDFFFSEATQKSTVKELASKVFLLILKMLDLMQAPIFRLISHLVIVLSRYHG